MASIDFSREEKTLIVERLQRYFRQKSVDSIVESIDQVEKATPYGRS